MPNATPKTTPDAAAKSASDFMAHYTRITQTADEMERAQDPDVQWVLDRSREAIESYKVVRERIDAALVELDEMFKTVGKTSNSAE